jgi:hypothetical protein
MMVDPQKIFCSYSRVDTEFVLKLANDLRSAGVSLWIDQLDIPPGARWDSAVENALMASSCLLVVLSSASVVFQNVLDEVAFALENQKKIVPVLHSRCAIPFRLQRLQYIDFTAMYNHGFAQLLRALNVLQPAQTSQALAPASQASQAASSVAHSEPGQSPQRLIYVLVVCLLAALIGISYWIIQPPIPLLPLSAPGLDTLPAQKAVLHPTPDDASQGLVGDRQQPNTAPQHELKMLNREAQEDVASPATRASEASESRVQGSSTHDRNAVVSVPESNEPSMASPLPAHDSTRPGKLDDWLFRSKGK